MSGASSAWLAGTGGRALLLAWVALSLVACVNRKRSLAGPPVPRALPTRSAVQVGGCADPTRHGVFGDKPDLQRADRDLDGDGVDEMVVMDATQCTPDRNCHWNLYRTEAQCHRYLGTVSAFAIQRLTVRDERGFFGLRGWWHLTGGKRLLMQEYRFRRGGYRLVEALLCRQDGDDLLLCEDRGR